MKSIQKIPVSRFIFITILFIATFLRVWMLSRVPPSPSLDEVSIGYNACSILHTGRDEYGNFLPILLRAYDDWRPALYVYLVIPFIAVFGLDAFAVRLPSVLLSLGTIILSYKVCLLLFEKDFSIRRRDLSSRGIALSVAFLLAISPWHIYLSRLGHEVNLGLFLTVFSIYLFLVGVFMRKSRFLFSSAISFGLGFSSYQSEKIILPILLIGLLLLFYKRLFEMRRDVLISALLFLLFALPAVFVTFSPQGLTRFQGTSVFSSTQASYESSLNLLHAKESGNMLGELYFNRRLVPVKIFVQQYVSHFNPNWLFTGSERESHKVPYSGLLYLFEAPFLLIGICALFLAKFDKRIKIFLLLWLFSSPIPASLTTEAPHAMRSFTFLPTLQIVEALGILWIYSLVKSFRIAVVPLFCFVCIVVFSVWKFYVGYFDIFPRTQADSFQSALFQAVSDIPKGAIGRTSVVVSNQNNLYQSYMFYLFANAYDPVTYLKNGGTGSGGYAITHRIGNIYFRPINTKTDNKFDTLYIGNPDDFSGVSYNKEYAYPSGKIGVVVVTYE